MTETTTRRVPFDQVEIDMISNGWIISLREKGVLGGRIYAEDFDAVIESLRKYVVRADDEEKRSLLRCGCAPGGVGGYR